MEYIRTKPFGSGNKVLLTCNPENEKAISLYQSLGFRSNGNADDDEIEMELTL